MAAAGEPTKGRHGVGLWSPQSVWGTPVTPATALGIVNFEFDDQSGLEPQFALGTPNAIVSSPGLHQTPFTINIERVQTSALPLKVQRVSGEMPLLTLGLGKQFDDASKDSKQIQDCRIHTAEFAAQEKGYLSCNLTGLGGLTSPLTTLVPTNLTQKPFRWYEAVLTKGGAAFGLCRGIRISINQNVDAQAPIPGVAPSTDKRGNTFQTSGNEVITFEIERYIKTGSSMTADTFTDFAIVLTFTDIAGGMSPNTLVLTLTNCEFTSERESVGPGTDYMHRVPGYARSWSLA